MDTAHHPQPISRADFQYAAIGLINRQGVPAVTPATLCDCLGVDQAQFGLHFGSVDEVFDGIIESMIATLQRSVHATLMRRRSLTESVRVALVAIWETVEQHPDVQRATQHLRMAGFHRASESGVRRRLEDVFQSHSEALLLNLERIHGISWELPVDQLGRILTVTLDGMVAHYLATADSAASRRILEIFAYHLAQHGRRVSKNQPQ